MPELFQYDPYILLRLVAAVILGGLIGFERGVNHDAGLRTHIIVCLGAASVMVVSECIVKQYGINSEIMRMGAQVISGVGFLGAGSIMVDGNRVRGITTAAGLWTTACVGLVVGSGYYLIAITIVALMLFAMLGLRSITINLQAKSLIHGIQLTLNSRDTFKQLLQKLTEEHFDIKFVKLKDEESGVLNVILKIKMPQAGMMDRLIYNLSGFEGVLEVNIL